MKREASNDVSFKLKILRNGEYLKNPQGATDLQDFVMACTVMEGINLAAIQAEIVIQDSANLIDSLTGSELWEITMQTADNYGVYRLYAYNIDSRARDGNADGYIVQCVSSEYLINEITNVFGSSKILFDKKTKAKDIIEKLLKDTKYIGTKKNIFVENSKNDHQFIATNWRAYDMIYWVGQRSTREKSKTKNPQNGFLFWENRMGFHFKSIDGMIDTINKQNYNTKSNTKNGEARLYAYTYQAKNGPDEGNDKYRIDSIVFPEDRNYLMALRNGSYAGYSIAFDPVVFTQSQLSAETFNPLAYVSGGDNDNMWKDMEHLGTGVKNPVDDFDPAVKSMVTRPRRIRYGIHGNRIFDKKSDTAETEKAQYGELSYFQAYQYLRVESLKNVQILLKIPGNLDLFSGYGMEVIIPKTKPKGDKFQTDLKYSGRYMIAGLRHMYNGKSLTTEVLLYKDSVKKKF